MLDPILIIILKGINDENCILNTLQGTPHIIECIWKHIKAYNSVYWKSLIKVGSDPPCPSTMTESGYERAMNSMFIGIPQDKYFLEITGIVFPQPKDINIDMMPFYMSNCFEHTKLPEYLRSYWHYIIMPLYRSYNSSVHEEDGIVCYLTIKEMKTFSETRNILSPISVLGSKCRIKNVDGPIYKGNGSSFARFYRVASDHERYMKIDRIRGGIYIGFNKENSVQVWDAKIKCDKSKNYKEIVDSDGKLDHVKPYIGQSTVLKGSTAYWITDRTPLECLPFHINQSYLQCFQLVTHQVSFWFEEFSTKNPIGVMPDSKITKHVRNINRDYKSQ